MAAPTIYSYLIDSFMPDLFFGSTAVCLYCEVASFIDFLSTFRSRLSQAENTNAPLSDMQLSRER